MHFQAQHINKSFAKEIVLRDVELSVHKGQTLSILGKSGCGKTTLLKILAGLLDADSGKIFLSDHEVTDVPAYRRNIVYLYQEPLLFPHLTVLENIAFGLHIRNYSKEEAHQIANDMLHALGMPEHADKRPAALSGGQKQRVAFGRAIVIKPNVLLLDEPFGSLDAETRGQMQTLFKSLAETFHITSVFVTHDVREALVIGDQFAFMRSGKLVSYADKSAFVEDEITGVKEELNFWRQL